MKYPQDVPVLTDGVVTLRAHRDTDLEPLYETTRDPESLRWTSIPFDATREDSRHFVGETMRIGWEERHHRGWAIETNDGAGNPRFAGNLDLRGMPLADVGFVLHPWARGRGIMRRALELASSWAFAEGGVEIIHWRAHVGNEASLRAAWAAGFHLTGMTPGFLYERERIVDVWAGHLRFGDLPGPKTTWHDSPVLDGDGIRLRPFSVTDVQRIVENCTDPTSRRWLAGLPSPYTAATAHDYINTCTWLAATGNKLTWAVADPETDELLANIALMGLDGFGGHQGEVGYWVHPEARGRGVMTQAVGLAVTHAIKTMGLRRLSLNAATGNVPSNRIAVANGFTLVGTETASEPLGDGTFADLNVYEHLA